MQCCSLSVVIHAEKPFQSVNFLSFFMNTITAFFLGMYEFRQNMTTSISSALLETYDAGRELAHCLTFRHYES